MSDTGEMLLRAIIDEPEADDLRLIYADWLDDHGDPERAEFIRVQVRLATLDEDDPARHDLEVQERDLLLDHQTRWLAGLLDIFNREIWHARPRFSRGFPERLSMTGREFLDLVPAIRRVTPVAHVNLREMTPFDELVRSPNLAAVRSLQVAGLDASRLAEFLRGPNLRLRHLGLGGLGLADVLTQWSGASELRGLLLYNNLYAQDISALAHAPALTHLEDLTLSGGLDADGLNELLNWQLPESVHLSLTLTALEPASLQRLAEWPALRGLRSLTLSRVDRLAGFAALLHLPDLPRLRKLYAESVVGPAEAQTLASLAQLRNLRLLWLKRSRLGDAGFVALAESPYLENLEVLIVWSNRNTPRGLQVLWSRFGDRVYPRPGEVRS